MAVPPTIFSPTRRRLARQRMRRVQRATDAPRYLLDEIAADMLERLAFVRLAPRNALVIGDVHGSLSEALERQAAK